MPTVPVAPTGAPPPEGPPWKLPATTYLGIGLVGVVLFLLGIYTPALAALPDAEIVRILVAIVGGLLAVVGLGRWNILRQLPGSGGGRSEAEMKESMPSLEFFSPPRSPGRPPNQGTSPVRRWARVSILLFVLLALLVSGIPLPTAASSPSANPTAAIAPATYKPPVPKCDPPFYPNYGAVDGLLPPLPNYADQTPCKVTHDEVHATYTSSTPGSAEQVNFPIVLPGNGTVEPGALYSDAYLGMVVQGDPSSLDNQSYAELVFTPTGSGANWSLNVAIWSLLLNTSCPDGLNFSWDDEYGCVVDDANLGGHSVLATDLPGDTFANVTFTGSATGSKGTLLITFNDSTDPSDSTNFTASAAKTGSYTFRPFYSAACDSCILNWSEPFGLGLGIDLCDDSPACFSYNATTQSQAWPLVVGSPESWNGLAFADDYSYVGFESSTGACGGVSGITPCDPLAEIGEYPAFTFDGSAIEFPGNYSWTTETFGGAIHEFNAYATTTDYTPFFVDELANSSAAGYIAPGDSLNVSVRVQDLGSLRWVNLTYAEPGLPYVNESMSLVAGAPSNGTYAALIPSTGTNGTVAYRVVATNQVGFTIDLPPVGQPASTVNRTRIPDVSVVLDETPAGCGGVSLDGGPLQANGTTETLTAADYAVRANGCYPYVFSGWRTTGGVHIVGPSSPSSTLELHANGTVTAVFEYTTPYDSVLLRFSPTNCGQVDVDGYLYAASPGGENFSLYDGSRNTFVDVASNCTGYRFGGWAVSNPTNLTILGENLTVDGNGTITATYLETSESEPVTLTTAPDTCGGVGLGTAGYTNDTTLWLTTGVQYPVRPIPCADWGYAAGNATYSGGVAFTGPDLSATAAGTFGYSYYQLTLVKIETSPGSCGGIEWNGVLETNGAVLNVTNHSLDNVLVEPCSGDYLEALTATGNLTLQGTVVTVNGDGTVLASFEPGPEEWWVGFITNPSSCGDVVFDGAPYANSQYVDVLPSSVHRLTATACPGYGFVDWTVGGGVALGSAPGDEDNLAYVNGSGSIEAVFHPLVDVYVETSPVACGGVEIAGLTYSNNESFELADGNTYSVAAVPCAHYVLSSWVTSGGATVANGTLTLSAPAIVAAVYVPALYAVHVAITPSGCGPLVLSGIDESDNTTVLLSAGAYPLAPTSCPGFELLGYTTDAGLSVSGSTLFVNGAGNLTQNYGPVPPVLTLAAPSSALVGSSVEVSVAIGVLVPPYNYTYNWSFGDGWTASTPSNFSSHTYSSPGTYEIRVTVLDPYGRTATAYSNVTIVASPSGPASSVSPTALLLIGVAAAVVVVGVIVALVRARRPAGTPAADDASPPAEQA